LNLQRLVWDPRTNNSWEQVLWRKESWLYHDWANILELLLLILISNLPKLIGNF
jgi:hypothetical protein